MSEWFFMVGIIVGILSVLGIFALIQFRKQEAIRRENSGYPEGYWRSKGIGLGIAIGAGIGIAMGSIPIGVGAGVAIGAAIGTGLEKKHKHEIRPMTKEEKKLKKQSILFTFGILIIGIVVFLITYFLTK